VLEEAPLVPFRLGQVERKSGLGVGEPAVHEPVTHGVVSPLVDIHIWPREHFVRAVRSDHSALRLLREDRRSVQNQERLFEEAERIT
jgi:hypothetical protein